MRLALSTLFALLATLPIHAQKILSFEPGGRKACSEAIHMEIPGPDDNPRTFDYACDRNDQAIEKTRLDALSRSFEHAPADQRVAFNALMVSFATFRDARVDTEVCTSGTGCGEMRESERAHLTDDFLHLFDDRAGTPPASPEDLAASDTALNDTYQKAFARLPAACTPAMNDCQSQAMLRDTQRDWIRFRDSWVALATLRSPSVPPEAWLALLTRRRAKQLADAFGA